MKQYLLSVYQPDGPPPPPESLQKIKDVAAQYGAEIFCSHSMPDFEGWRKAPEWYE